jgi:hypothetical protein
MKRWISIGDYIINPEYFNLFYIEEVPVDMGSFEWHLFGEDKSQTCWRLDKFQYQLEAENNLHNIYNQIQD